MTAHSWFHGLLLAALLPWHFAVPVNAVEPFQLAADDVVVFLGGTNMLHLQQAGYLEAILTRSQAATAGTRFRDLSWEADTVFRQGTVIERWRKDGFGSRAEQLQRVETTVVIVQFGQLESMAGPDHIDRFVKAYQQLIDQFQAHARLVVLVTPTRFERSPNPLVPDLTRHNASLALYIKAIRQIAKERDLGLVDLYSGGSSSLTDNGMHITAAAQQQVARQIASQLGVALPGEKEIEPLRLAVMEKHRLWYDYWRPANWKLLFGDDSRRQFTRGGENWVPFREEWKFLHSKIALAEDRIWKIARGDADPGPDGPGPEKLHADPSADVEKELASFRVPDGFKVNLFASEKEGLTSPLNLRWDPAGRMYVTVTTTYPHVFPGRLPNDKVILLEDRDDDGRADRSTVFAEGLNIPTGLEWGEGGLYVGQNTELLFLEDTDRDGQADRRRVLLGGFGNGDSHQTINSFVWSPAGELFFGQGDGCESRVETPWGARNLFQAGFYRFRPRRLQLDPLLDDFMGPGNPWGVVFDRWGQVFCVDGAGGVTFLSPGQLPTTHRLKLGRIGDPGGYCGVGLLDGRHLPASMQGHFVVGDFKGNRVKRFSLKDDGSGFALNWEEAILQSSHRNFRPVDVKVGPDGAIYVVDWYNPITCHQDDSYRDPTRDKAHGRIWRISRSEPSTRPADLLRAPLGEVLDALMSPESWTRYQAKRALTVRDPVRVGKAIDSWVRSLDPALPGYEHHLYEALGCCATLEIVQPALLRRLLAARTPQARAYASRIVGRWHDRLEDPLSLLASRIEDEHPRVRMEAVLAAAAIPTAESITMVARVTGKPMDGWTGYAFKQAVHHLAPHWRPAMESGRLSFRSSGQLAAVLNEAGGRGAIESLKKLLQAKDLDPAARAAAIGTILSVGTPAELRDYGLDPQRFTRSGTYQPGQHAAALERLLEVTRPGTVRPEGDLPRLLGPLVSGDNPRLRAAALKLVGTWNVDQLEPQVLAVAKEETLPVMVRAAAMEAMARMELPAANKVLLAASSESQPLPLRSAAVQSLAKLDIQAASRQAVALFADTRLEKTDAGSTLQALLGRDGGAEALAGTLQGTPLDSEAARRMLEALFASGRSDALLVSILGQAIGTARRTPEYDPGYVKTLAARAGRDGKADRGALIFQAMACASCHRISGSGGGVGPDLTALGTTLSAERIVEELLWPSRQVKEGYTVLEVLTTGGRIYQGYQRTTKESQQTGELVIQDLSSGKLVTFAEGEVEEKRAAGSAMPAGLTSLLSAEQLRDLVRYLTKLGKIE